MNRSTLNALIVGLLAAIVCASMVYIRYAYFNNSLPEFSLMSLGTKAVLLLIAFIAGYISIKKNDEMAAVKPMFRSMFIVILFGEVAISAMDYLCMFTIFPNFIDTFHANNLKWLAESSQWPEERKEQALGDILSMKQVGIRDILQSLMQGIIISSIFAIIFAFILTTVNRKNKQLAALQKSGSDILNENHI